MREEVEVKIILKEDMGPLGLMGSVVEVARGYARNYLIPQGKAMEATPGNLAKIQRAKVKYEQVRASERDAARDQLAKVAGLSLTIAQRVGEEDRLYGSVTRAMIAAALQDQGFDVDRKQLELPEPIKKLGTYQVTVRLAPEVKGAITVEVVAENA